MKKGQCKVCDGSGYVLWMYGGGWEDCLHCNGSGECPHKNTVALNEEGNAGVYCSDCGEKLSDEC